MSEVEKYNFMWQVNNWLDEMGIDHVVTFEGAAMSVQIVFDGTCFVTILHVFNDATLEDLKARLLRTIRRYNGRRSIEAAIDEVVGDE